jgi:hypothetical protein
MVKTQRYVKLIMDVNALIGYTPCLKKKLNLDSLREVLSDFFESINPAQLTPHYFLAYNSAYVVDNTIVVYASPKD